MEGELLRVWFGRTSFRFQAWNSSAETFKLSSPSRRSAGPQTKAVELNIAPEKTGLLDCRYFHSLYFKNHQIHIFFYSGVKKSKFDCEDFWISDLLLSFSLLPTYSLLKYTVKDRFAITSFSTVPHTHHLLAKSGHCHNVCSLMFLHWEEHVSNVSKASHADIKMTLVITRQHYLDLQHRGALFTLSHLDISFLPSLSITFQSRVLFSSNLDSICVSATWGQQAKILFSLVHSASCTINHTLIFNEEKSIG